MFANPVCDVVTYLMLTEQIMPGFRAEMRYIDNRRRIVRPKLHNLTGAQVFQTFAQFQNRQGAQHASRIDGVSNLHERQIASVLQNVHNLVTA